MLFPNHPDFQEIRPGMGYAPGARNFGYAPGARNFDLTNYYHMGDVAHMGYAAGARNFSDLGDVAHMGYAPGARGLGAVSDAQMQAAWDAGLDGDTLDALSAAGATDADIQALMAGTTDVPTLMAKYAGLKTTEGTTVTTTPQGPTISQAFGPAGQIPSGSTILYTATFNSQKAFITASSVISDIASHLAQFHMSMISNNVQQSGIFSEASFTMTIMDSIGHQYISDAQSILDSLLQQYTNNGKIDSSVTVVSPGTTASGSPSGQPQPPGGDSLTWLEGNALYIALGLGGFVILRDFVGKKRR